MKREPPVRAADELAEVVAGDVLHDLAARVHDRAVGEHERDAEDEVARERRTGGAAGPRGCRRGRRRSSGRRAGRARGAGLRRERGRERRTAGSRPRRCTSGRPPRARAPGHAARVEIGAESHLPPLGRGGRKRCRRLVEARNARQARSAPAGAAGTGPAPRRRAAASGSPCRGWRSRRDRTRAAAARTPRGRARENICGIEHALSTPTPCSPVSEPPASMQAPRIASASAFAALGLAGFAAS